jgi:S-formylglutathione hydrolase
VTFAFCSLIASLIASGAVAAVLDSHVDTEKVAGPVDYTAIVPDDYFGQKTVYPLVLFLHDREAGAGYASRLAPLFQRLWQNGVASPCVVVIPDCRQSLFLDYQDGSERWESFLLDDFLPYVQQNFRVALRREKNVIAGIGEGGAAALRLGFKYPNRFGVVVALQPSIPPASRWHDVKRDDYFWYGTGYLKIRYGDPIDEKFWNANNPAWLVHENRKAILAELPAIYLECGLSDSYGLYKGTEFLHEQLVKAGIPHEYHAILGADHGGRDLDRRLIDALLFMERRLHPPPPDPAVEPIRKKAHDLRRSAGLKD